MNSARCTGRSIKLAADRGLRIAEVRGTKVKGTVIEAATKGELNHCIEGSTDERRA